MTTATLRRPRVVKRCALGHAIEGDNARQRRKQPAECLICYEAWRAQVAERCRETMKAAWEKRSAERRAVREARETAAALRAALEAAGVVELPADEEEAAAEASPYARAVAELEPVFGPSSGWTREQDRRCTELMYKMLGWPADQRPRPFKAARQEAA